MHRGDFYRGAPPRPAWGPGLGGLGGEVGSGMNVEC